ncbi:type-F conjugative transfer system protein TraW [Qipengyuania citrea]|uniref:type-F conjugative transfer system protein TraW n=1 Tax=Qipengyuania citrea TaxID=225971 RepID=UPI003299E0A4
MRLAAVLATGVTLLSLSAVPPFVMSAMARDHGVMGQTWPVIEPDLLTTIDTRLKTLESNGGIERMQKELAAKTEHRVRNPIAVSGIGATENPREWLFDPSIVVQDDIVDAKGNVIAARGTKVNPLGLVELKTDLVFVDGRDPDQLKWATGRWAASKAKIIFVAGSPFDRMGEYQRRFFFDQQGKLTEHFGIAHVPAIVSQEGEALKVRELVLPKAGGA